MLERKVTYYKPHGACWRLSNNYFELDVDDHTGVMQGLSFKNDINNANFMGNEESTATDVAWRDRYIKDMDHRAPMYGWTGDIFLKARLETDAEDKLAAMYTVFSDDIREIDCFENSITCSYTGNSEYVGGLRNIEIVSTYRLERDQIHWDFSIRNVSQETMVIGELGFPMVLNTIVNRGSAKTGLNHRKVEGERYWNEHCFQTQYLAAGHSSCYSAVRSGGKGERLMIIPKEDTFIEAIGEGGEYGHESMMRTKGTLVYLYSKSAARVPHENQHTEFILSPGEKKKFGFLFLRAKDIHDMKDKFVQNGKIDVKVIPGMVIPEDGEGKLLLRSIKTFHSIETDDGIEIEQTGGMGGHYHYKIRVSKEGQLKVKVNYGDNEWTTLVFYGTPPLEKLIKARADFIVRNQQVRDPEDPVCYSFRSWDNDLERMVDNDMDAGLGPIDIGGSDDRSFAPPLFLSAKNVMYPNQNEINALDDFVEKFLYGKLQNKNAFTVKASLLGSHETYEACKGKKAFEQLERFLVKDDDGNETQWRDWSYIARPYNYSHVYNVYYNMYRIAKHTSFRTSRAAKDYLLFAYKTAMALYLDSTYEGNIRYRGYRNFEEGNFSESHAPLGSFRLTDILEALEDEGLTEERKELLAMLEKRSEHFVTEEYPFAAEFGGGGAGPNVSAAYVLGNIFDEQKLKNTVVRLILASRGPFPRWYSYCTLNNFIGNYRTSSFAPPLLDCFEDTGDDYLLRTAYGSLLAHWCCVDSDGKGYNSREFRFNPVDRDNPKYNYYVSGAQSSELGVGLNCNLRFLGAALATDEHFGLTGYGCTATETKDGYQLEPWSGFGFKVNVIPLGIKLETINVKINALEISKVKDSIEIITDEAVPEVRTGVVVLNGLRPGTATVSKDDDSMQLTVEKDGHLVIEGVCPGSTVKIWR